MRILVVTATLNELIPLLKLLDVNFKDDEEKIDVQFQSHHITFLISGIGMGAMAFCLGKHLNSTFDLAFNIGIAGTFNRQTKLGEVVWVTQDTLSELGAEDGDDFLTLSELTLKGDFIFKGTSTSAYSTINGLDKVSGITVNTVHGNEFSIRVVRDRLHPDVESMEGAAFIMCCNKLSVKCFQIRAISNYVEKRNRLNWNIGLALSNLAECFYNILLELNQH